ncbi:CHAT domain-containing protein [Anabaena sp. UHCC 0204]|uniref:CHAT domain-containing protein n=1 Tax=Anabaena sp. UHCC 0204 TaxID=2590009 RepID=UPI001447199D|nr:CHAT domain-containing protein [Anabaena sp. UHCC 0204]MTJ07986.1 CHAT domain-containing protein [Anabaena sp. UHCC 0204]
MDEQRLQAYQQLIQQLLSCANGEELPILQANTELLDADFLQLLEVGVAAMSTQEGQENRANKLMFLASQLSQALNIPLEENTPETETQISEADIETYLPFLLKVLQTTANSQGNPQEVYPLLKANTDKLNLTFAQVLQHWATKRLEEEERDTAEYIATNISIFSNLIQQFPLNNKANNMEIAITGYEIALTVFTRQTSSKNWAALHNNLAVAYWNRIRGDKAENLENAIAAYTAALEVYTHHDFPVDWAMTQNNLGLAYNDRIRGDEAENLENAIAAYTQALEVRTRTDLPVNWATTQNNFGNAYSNRIRGDKAENLEMAIAAYTAALEVYTRTNFPVDWAMTQNNLGNAYSDRIRGDKTENREMANAAYTQALEVRTRTDFPLDNAETLENLGIAYQESQQFDLAYSTLADAIATVEDLRGEIISGEESKRKQAEKWNQLFRLMVEVCLALGKETEAITYIERSKTRNLVEQIFNRDLKTIFPSNVVIQLEQLRDEIASGQNLLQNLLQTGKAENATSLARHLQKLRQKRQKLQDEYLPMGSSFKFTFTSLEKIVDQETTIIEWYIAINKIFAFVIQPGGKEIRIWQSSSADFEALLDWDNKYVNDYKQNKEIWENELEQNLQNLAKILHLEEILNVVPQECEKLILIPHRFLHLFPLHALPVQNSYLMDLFPQGVGYVPSLQILQQIQQRQRDDFQSLFAIQTPTEDLYEKDLGAVAAIKQQFNHSYVLKKDKAKESAIIQNPENLKTAHNLFFFCHGSFNSNYPLDSGLQLADEVLTLADIITHIKLENCRLVTLAACETGMIDGTNISDEYIGLPNGFLLAGSTNVVGSLWTVSAVATALLMVKFYEELKHQSNIVLALQNSQRWLRDTNILGFRKWLPQSNLDEDWQDELNDYFSIEEQKQGSNIKIFASPFYWSAFCAIGKGV